MDMAANVSAAGDCGGWHAMSADEVVKRLTTDSLEGLDVAAPDDRDACCKFVDKLLHPAGPVDHRALHRNYSRKSRIQTFRIPPKIDQEKPGHRNGQRPPR
jgi:hypothetical protein